MEAYIYDALRTPRGRGNRKGALIGTTATQLAVSVMQEIQQRHDLDGRRVLG